MADIDDLAALLVVGDRQKAAIAAEDPYAGLAGIGSAMTQQVVGAQGYSTTDKIVAAALSGLIGGTFGGLSDNYQGRAQDAYADVVLGRSSESGPLSRSLFSEANRQRSIFAAQKELMREEKKLELADKIEEATRKGKIDLANDSATEKLKAYFDNPEKAARAEAIMKGGTAAQPIVETEYSKALKMFDGDEVAARQYVLETNPDVLETRLEQKRKENELALQLEGSKRKLPLKGEIPSSMITELASSKAVIDEADEIANAIGNGTTWSEVRAAKAFSGMDEQGIGLRLANLADRLKRARSGASTSSAEDKVFEKLIGGDLTASPQQSAALLRKLADSERRFGDSQLALMENYQNSGVPGLREGFAVRNTTTAPPTDLTADGKFRIDHATKKLIPVR